MTFINPINVNTNGVGGAYGFGSKPQTKAEEGKEEAVTAQAPEQKQVPADQVLNFLAQSAATVKPKTIDPSKYVDSASAERIAGFMSSFEDIVATNLAAIDKEFPGMSDSAKQALALAQTEQSA